MIESVLALFIMATVSIAIYARRKHVAFVALLKAKHEADERAKASALAQDEAIKRRDFMAEKFDPLFESTMKLRERHADALNEMHAELALHRQRTLILVAMIERLLPETTMSDARKRAILQEIEPMTMMNRIAEMHGGLNDGEAGNSSAAEGA